MANLSWLFYKGYYQGFNHWQHPKGANEKEESQIESFFSDKNALFTDFRLMPPSVKSKEIRLKTIYPGLLSGSGYTHGIGSVGEFKIGFHLDYTTGLPIIPGSSVKGVLRSMFPGFVEHPEKKWEIKDIESEDEVKKAKAIFIASQLNINGNDEMELFTKVHELELTIFEGFKIDTSLKEGKLFYTSLYERDIFYDAKPVKGNKEKRIFGTDSITPHLKTGMSYEEAMLKNPVPLLFLKVLPNVVYEFPIKCSVLEIHGVNAGKKKALFQSILETIGIGAKTNVGYGQLVPSEEDIHDNAAPILPDDVPVEMQRLQKGSLIDNEATITDITDTHITIQFSYHNKKGRITRKKEKYPAAQVGGKVSLKLQQPFVLGQTLNCSLLPPKIP